MCILICSDYVLYTYDLRERIHRHTHSGESWSIRGFQMFLNDELQWVVLCFSTKLVCLMPQTSTLVWSNWSNNKTLVICNVTLTDGSVLLSYSETLRRWQCFSVSKENGKHQQLSLLFSSSDKAWSVLPLSPTPLGLPVQVYLYTTSAQESQIR